MHVRITASNSDNASTISSAVSKTEPSALVSSFKATLAANNLPVPAALAVQSISKPETETLPNNSNSGHIGPEEEHHFNITTIVLMVLGLGTFAGFAMAFVQSRLLAKRLRVNMDRPRVSRTFEMQPTHSKGEADEL